MEYKASLDTLSKVITAGTILLFILLIQWSVRALMANDGDKIIILTHGGLILLLVAIVAYCYLYAPQKYVIMNDELIIERIAKNKVIRLADIVEVRPVDNDMRGTIRTFGNGGLFGYYGKFYNSKIGSMTWYSTQRHNLILIRTKSENKIVISPDDMSFMEHFSRLAQHPQ